MRLFSSLLGGSDDRDEKEDGGLDRVGRNPTGRPRKSSAGTRRKKDRKMFGGTEWDADNE